MEHKEWGVCLVHCFITVPRAVLANSDSPIYFFTEWKYNLNNIIHVRNEVKQICEKTF